MSLSDERESVDLIEERVDVEWVYPEENVKEFIEKIKDRLTHEDDEITSIISDVIDEEAGGKLA